MEEYKYPENIDVISGFGEGSEYELDCQKMVIAWLNWLKENKEAKVSFKQYKNIYGITFDESEDCKLLQEHMNKSIGDEATGAMMQACTNHVMYAHTNGWDKYIEEVTK